MPVLPYCSPGGTPLSNGRKEYTAFPFWILTSTGTFPGNAPRRDVVQASGLHDKLDLVAQRCLNDEMPINGDPRAR